MPDNSSRDAIPMPSTRPLGSGPPPSPLRAHGRRKLTTLDNLSVITVLVDEIAFYSATIGSKQEQEEFVALLRDLVARGRAAGISVVAATQRPSFDIIPTSLRDLFGYRAVFRCTTPNISNIVLGHGWAEQGHSATDIQPTNQGAAYLIAKAAFPVASRSPTCQTHRSPPSPTTPPGSADPPGYSSRTEPPLVGRWRHDRQGAHLRPRQQPAGRAIRRTVDHCPAAGDRGHGPGRQRPTRLPVPADPDGRRRHPLPPLPAAAHQPKRPTGPDDAWQQLPVLPTTHQQPYRKDVMPAMQQAAAGHMDATLTEPEEERGDDAHD